MAYKFQLGAAKLAGSVESTGDITGVEASFSDVTDATAAAIVAQIDAGEIAGTKVAIADSKILIGDSSGDAQEFVLSGDVTMTAGGAVTVANDAVTLAKMAHESQGDILTYGAGGAPAVLAKGAEHQVLKAGASEAAYGLLVDANISSSAAIAISKLAASTISGKALGTNLDALAVDDSSIEYSAGSAFNGSAGSTIQVKALGVTNAMLAGSIVNAKLTNSTISGKALGTTLAAVTQGNGISTFSYDGSTARTIQLQLSGGANSALVLDAGGIQLAASIGGNRTFSGDLTVDGDLLVSGATVTMNVATMSVEDKDIVLGSGNGTGNVVDGTGVILEGGSGDDLTYLWQTDKMELKKGSAFANMKAGTFTGALAGNATTATALANAQTIGNVSFDGSAAIVPETIAIAADGADAAFSILFTSGATGAQQPKSDPGLMYNPSSNQLTAGSFFGNGAGLSNVAPQRGIVTWDASAALTLQAADIGKMVYQSVTASAPRAINLPAHNVAMIGKSFLIKVDNAAAQNITISPNGSGKIDGVSGDIALQSDDAAVEMFYVSQDKWLVL